MAIDPKEQVGGDTIWEPGYPDRTQVPNGVTLPPGVTTDGDYYAIVKKYRDGTSDVTWYKRKTAPKGSTADPPFGPTVPGPVAAATQKQYEDDVAKEAAAARATTGDTTVQGQQSRVQVNPASGQPEMATIFPPTAGSPTPQTSYRPATAAKLTQAGYTPRTEGTPDPKSPSGFDNENPRIVVRGPDGTMVGQPRALTDDERKAWNISRQMSRNPGGLSDADLRAQQTQTARQPVDGHPGYSVVKTINPQTGQTETHYEKDDAPGVTVQLPADLKTTFISDGHGGQIAVNTKPDGTFTTQPVPGVSSPQQLTVSGTVYERGPDGVYKPAAGIPDPNAPLPPGAPDVDLSDPQKAYDSFMRLYQWGASQVNRGEKSADWLKNLIAGPHEALSAVLDREKEMTRRAENTQSNQLTQRSQDVSFADNRLSNATQGLTTATSAADKINSLAGPGLHAYSSTLLGTLALQGLQNQALGGTNALPASVIPGPVAGQPGAAMPGLPSGAVPDAAAAQAEADRQRAMAAQGAVVGPVTAGATATNAAAVNPSGANVQAATDAAMAGSNAAFGGLGVGPGTSGPVFAPQPPTNIQPQATPPPFIDRAPAPGSPPFSIPPGQVDLPGPLQLDPMSQPQGMATGAGGVPTMAMMGSRLGQNPYAYALDALRRMGIGEDSIAAGHQDFLSGGA